MEPGIQDIAQNTIPAGFEILPTGAALANAVTQTLLRSSLPDLDDASKRFVPRSALFKLLGRQQVKQLVELLLAKEHRPKFDALVEYICPEELQCGRCGRKSCTGGRVLFAALIWIARQDLIPELLNSPGVCDSHLSASSSGKLDTEAGWRLNLLQKLKKPVEAELLCHVQLHLRAPFLELIEPQDTNAFAFEDAVTLPWTGFTVIHEPILGNPCEVAKVHIHPAHHALAITDNRTVAQQDQHVDNIFALKIFPENTRQKGHGAFKQELLANQQLPKHDRLTPLLTAFQHRSHCYLVFPWAHGGTLQDFWKIPTVDKQYYSADWVMRECLGLAEGLAILHGFSPSRGGVGGTAHASAGMLHADIKPSNILCFQSQETVSLKLADFGFSKQVGPSSKLASKDLRHTNTYRAPEQDIEQEITLKSDVWSLGCLFLEFITWYLVGWPGIEDFSKKRLDDPDDREATHARGSTCEDIFFTKHVQKRLWLVPPGLQIGAAIDALPRDENARKLARRVYSLRLTQSVQVGCRVKDTVKEHISFLSNPGKHKDCTQQLRVFLKFIQERILVVDVEHRAGSQAVRDFLQEQIPDGS